METVVPCLVEIRNQTHGGVSQCLTVTPKLRRDRGARQEPIEEDVIVRCNTARAPGKHFSDAERDDVFDEG